MQKDLIKKENLKTFKLKNFKSITSAKLEIDEILRQNPNMTLNSIAVTYNNYANQTIKEDNCAIVELLGKWHWVKIMSKRWKCSKRDIYIGKETYEYLRLDYDMVKVEVVLTIETSQ